MTSKLNVLQFFSQKEKNNMVVSHKMLMKQFTLTASASFRWLGRLRDQGLIEYAGISSLGNKFYRLTEKGKQRLQWLKNNYTHKKESKGNDSILDKIDAFLFDD